MKVSFQIKLFISLVAFFSVLFALLGSYYYIDMGRQLYQEMSGRAKIQAEEIAIIPSLRKQVADKNIPAIHDFMQRLAARSDASFIVIGDNEGRGNDSNLLIVFYVQIMPDDLVMQLHRF